MLYQLRADGRTRATPHMAIPLHPGSDQHKNTTLSDFRLFMLPQYSV